MIKLTKLILTLALTLYVGIDIAVAESHYVPGMGTYGVSNEKYTCPACGKTVTAGQGHMCERPDRTTTRTHSSGSSADDRAAAGRISGDPDLLVNQTSYTPVDYSSYQAPTQNNGSGSEASKLLNDFRNGKLTKKSNTTRNIIIALLIGAGALWWYRREK